MDQSLEELFASKAEIEYNLKQAIIQYPDDKNIIDWKTSYERSFPTRSEIICLKDNAETSGKREEFVEIRGEEEKEKTGEEKEDEIEMMEEDKEEKIEEEKIENRVENKEEELEKRKENKQENIEKMKEDKKEEIEKREENIEEEIEKMKERRRKKCR